ncbi:MAG: nucleoside deaminase [Mycobacterium sp.]
MQEHDIEMLELSIELARNAKAAGNHPFGAVLTDLSGTVLHRAENTVMTAKDATGHAETNLIRMASAELSATELRETVLFSSTEPCAMCSGAIYIAGIRRLVFAVGKSELLEFVEARRSTTDFLRIASREILQTGPEIVDVAGPLDPNTPLYAAALAVHE